jgi:hypothetical protein
MTYRAVCGRAARRKLVKKWKFETKIRAYCNLAEDASVELQHYAHYMYRHYIEIENILYVDNPLFKLLPAEMRYGTV